MKILTVLMIPFFLYAQVHYAKLEPYDRVTLKAAVSGEVLDANLSAEGRVVKHGRIIHIDDRLDRINLKQSQESLKLLGQMLQINQESAKSLKESMQRAKASYERIKGLSTASKTQKDNAYSSYAAAKTQYLGTKEKIASLKKQILDMQYKIAQLEEMLSKKSIVLEGAYLYRLIVRKGDFVAPGTPLAKVEDLSRGKLVLFLEPEEVADLKSKKIYLNDKETDYTVSKLWRVADEKYISSYRAEIYLPVKEGQFSQLIKVEIK
jgi:hypothetical protein